MDPGATSHATSAQNRAPSVAAFEQRAAADATARGDCGSNLAAVDGRLWVANGGERSVSVLDEATGDEVTRIGFETGVHDLAAADGSVWVLTSTGRACSTT